MKKKKEGKPRGPKPAPIEVTERQKAILEQIVKRTTNSQRLVKRAEIILKAAEGKRNVHIANEVGSNREKVHRWRGRWGANSERLKAIEEEGSDKELRQAIEEILSDAPGRGAPPKFTAEQIVQIVAISCEKPENSGRPVTHWTPKELADEAVKRDIVESISPRQAGRFLK